MPGCRYLWALHVAGALLWVLADAEVSRAAEKDGAWCRSMPTSKHKTSQRTRIAGEHAVSAVALMAPRQR